jgi:hypothetical protein
MGPNSAGQSLSVSRFQRLSGPGDGLDADFGRRFGHLEHQ